MSVKTHLVAHHSLTKDGKTVSAQAIRRWHTGWKYKGNLIAEPDARALVARGDPGVRGPWSDVGYHYLCELIGNRYELLVGRPLLARAAAAREKRMNTHGVHVCFVGNFDLAPPPQAMFDYAIPHLADLCEALDIPIDAEHVIGHRDVAPYKSCPGTEFDLNLFRALLLGD